jgi:hypothetical protein
MSYKYLTIRHTEFTIRHMPFTLKLMASRMTCLAVSICKNNDLQLYQLLNPRLYMEWFMVW